MQKEENYYKEVDDACYEFRRTLRQIKYSVEDDINVKLEADRDLRELIEKLISATYSLDKKA